MIFREATVPDIDDLMAVRFSVLENPLNTPGLVTEKDCEEYIMRRGKGWVCEINYKVVGFSIVDLQEHNVWALFVRPEQEGRGIGTTLHRLMMDWYFSQTKEKAWLGTAPKTKAELFYPKNGWTAVGMVNKGEVKFEMTAEDWQRMKNREQPT